MEKSNYVACLVSCENCKFETELRDKCELPFDFLGGQSKTTCPGIFIPYLIVKEIINVTQPDNTKKTTEKVVAIYRVDGPHQRTIKPRNLTLVWTLSRNIPLPKTWIDERTTLLRPRVVALCS